MRLGHIMQRHGADVDVIGYPPGSAQDAEVKQHRDLQRLRGLKEGVKRRVTQRDIDQRGETLIALQALLLHGAHQPVRRVLLGDVMMGVGDEALRGHGDDPFGYIIARGGQKDHPVHALRVHIGQPAVCQRFHIAAERLIGREPPGPLPAFAQRSGFGVHHRGLLFAVNGGI